MECEQSIDSWRRSKALSAVWVKESGGDVMNFWKGGESCLNLVGKMSWEYLLLRWTKE